MHAVRFELVHIAPGGWVFPHLPIHRRSGEDGLVGGKQHGRGEIVGKPMGHAGQQVGRRRRDDDQVGFPGEPDMPDLGLVLEVEKLGEDGLLAKRRDR